MRREVNYAFYGTYACNTRIVRYVWILRRSLVLKQTTQKHIIFSHKFLFVCAMQIENLQYRKNSTNTAVARALLFLYLLSRRGGRTIHRIVRLSARSIP